MRGMRTTLSPLPNDMDALQALVIEHVAKNEQLLAENHRIKAQVLTLQEQLHLAHARRYAASSEKISPDQIRLFNEAETEVGTEADTLAAAEAGVVTIAAHTLTWNCKHIANVERFEAIEAVCIESGYRPPIICTPEELTGEH